MWLVHLVGHQRDLLKDGKDHPLRMFAESSINPIMLQLQL